MLIRNSFVAAMLAFAAALAPATAPAAELLVFAAASLKNAMDEIAADWNAATGHTAVVSLAGSSALARQIAHGAPADVYISASQAWMDALEKEGRIEAGSRFDLLRNRIVLVAHGAGAAPVEIAPGFDLAGLLGDGWLAMALVDAVPAGVYGKAALTSLGVWDRVAPKVAQADNVRAALALVRVGEAPYGVVYRTDTNASDEVTIVGVFPESAHPPIVYPAAAVAGRGNPLAAAFLDRLRGAAARATFERQGFEVVGTAN